MSIEVVQATQERNEHLYPQSWSYLSLQQRPESQWRDVAFRWIEGTPTLPLGHTLNTEQPLFHDLYFTPLSFSDASRRSNETAVGFGCLFADLDPVDPSSVPLKPTAAWETSPGSYQALWWIDVPDDLTYSEWAEVNRAMTHTTGADKGGWMGSKVLRVPGTLNYKRFDPDTGVAPRGRLLWFTDHLVYPIGVVKNHVRMDLASSDREMPADHPSVPNEKAWVAIVQNAWDRIPLSVRTLILTAKVRDRSFHIRQTAFGLLRAGFSTESTFRILSGVQWNKFRDRPQMLWYEVLRAKDDLR